MYPYRQNDGKIHITKVAYALIIKNSHKIFNYSDPYSMCSVYFLQFLLESTRQKDGKMYIVQHRRCSFWLLAVPQKKSIRFLKFLLEETHSFLPNPQPETQLKTVIPSVEIVSVMGIGQYNCQSESTSFSYSEPQKRFKILFMGSNLYKWSHAHVIMHTI